MFPTATASRTQFWCRPTGRSGCRASSAVLVSKVRVSPSVRLSYVSLNPGPMPTTLLPRTEKLLTHLHSIRVIGGLGRHGRASNFTLSSATSTSGSPAAAALLSMSSLWMPNYLASSKTRYRCFFSPVSVRLAARCPLQRSAGAGAFRLVPGVSGSPALHVALVAAALSSLGSSGRSPSLLSETSPRAAAARTTTGGSVTVTRRRMELRRVRGRLRNDRHAHIASCSAPVRPK
uniref:Uncharacterized protein n=1 Tax=Setaria viridis TaxID=4556 RepID=A0A4U6W6W3_SETVI|nr:hypothetical protein SEVIR_1G041000v2 [Setaria viridis]